MWPALFLGAEEQSQCPLPPEEEPTVALNVAVERLNVFLAARHGEVKSAAAVKRTC